MIDHLIPEAVGGPTEEANLWLACAECNAYKGDRISVQDPLSGETVPLYNPRRQSWSDHFRWTDEADQVVGLTPIGRATVHALRLNRPLLIQARQRWVAVGWHPPKD